MYFPALRHPAQFLALWRFLFWLWQENLAASLACFLPVLHTAGCLGGSGGGRRATSCQPTESHSLFHADKESMEISPFIEQQFLSPSLCENSDF